MRKGKGCCNNIFVVNGIIHDILSSVKKNPVMIQFYDFSQMFHSINLEELTVDMFDVGLQDDTLSLLYEANKEVNPAVKTPYGLTERQTIKSSVLQGDTWGTSFASGQVDNMERLPLRLATGTSTRGWYPLASWAWWMISWASQKLGCKPMNSIPSST